MSQRFFCSQRILDQPVTLHDSEAHHLSHVMRKKVADEVVLFDGSGAEFTARIVEVTRKLVTLEILERIEVDRELRHPLWIASALPKGDRQVWMIQKLVELGVTRLIPLITERSVSKPNKSAVTRLTKQAIEASKQCGRNILMTIDEACDLHGFSQRVPTGMHCMIADPSGTACRLNRGEELCFAIGPEGGFTTEELEWGKKYNWPVVSLGSRILRTETAAAAVAAWGSLRNDADWST